MTTTTATFERPVDRTRELGGRAGVVRFLEVPKRRYVMIDGEGPPGDEAFSPRVPGLYSTAYKLRFGLKDRAVVTKVGPLEGQWWASDGVFDLDAILEGSRETWRWILMIALPDEATNAEIERALDAGRRKLDEPHAANLRVESLDEGRSPSSCISGRTRPSGPRSSASMQRSPTPVSSPGIVITRSTWAIH